MITLVFTGNFIYFITIITQKTYKVLNKSNKLYRREKVDL